MTMSTDCLSAISRQLTRLLDQDVQEPEKREALDIIQKKLITAQEVGDKKLQIVQSIQDFTDGVGRQLEVDDKNLGESKLYMNAKTY